MAVEKYFTQTNTYIYNSFPTAHDLKLFTSGNNIT